MTVGRSFIDQVTDERRMASLLSCLAPSRFDRTVHSLDLVGAGDRDGVCDGFHSEPALGSFHDGAAMSFFCSCDVESLLQNLGSHGLAAEQALKLSHAAFEFSNAFRATTSS